MMPLRSRLTAFQDHRAAELCLAEKPLQRPLRAGKWLVAGNLLLAGCTTIPTIAKAPQDSVAQEPLPYVATDPRPLNCGTPDEFKICPLPDRPAITVEKTFSDDFPSD